MKYLLLFILFKIVGGLESTTIKTILKSGEVLDVSEEVCNKDQEILDYFDNRACYYNNSHIPNTESYKRQ